MLESIGIGMIGLGIGAGLVRIIGPIPAILVTGGVLLAHLGGAF